MSRPKHGPGIGRRALPALALTGASGVLLLVLDHPSGSDASAADVAASAAVTAVPTTLPPASSIPPSSAAPTTSNDSTGSTAASTAATAVAPTVAPTAAPTSTVPPAPAASAECGVVDGPTVQTKWGPVQVEASVAANGTICAADAIVTPNDRSKSVRINDRAVPVLDQRAVEAQNTVFQGVSGATITSNAYKQSLQAILDSVMA